MFSRNDTRKVRWENHFYDTSFRTLTLDTLQITRTARVYVQSCNSEQLAIPVANRYIQSREKAMFVMNSEGKSDV